MLPLLILLRYLARVNVILVVILICHSERVEANLPPDRTLPPGALLPQGATIVVVTGQEFVICGGIVAAHPIVTEGQMTLAQKLIVCEIGILVEGRRRRRVDVDVGGVGVAVKSVDKIVEFGTIESAAIVEIERSRHG